MTTTLCKDCKQWIELNLFEEHQREKHEQEIQANILYSKNTIKQRVPYILAQSKSAQSNPGWLCEIYYRYFPFKGFRIVYNSITGMIQTPDMPPSIYAEFLRNIGSVMRVDRSVRRAHLEWNGSIRAQGKRGIQEEFSTNEWAINK